MTKKSVEILGLPIISISEGVELGVSKTLVIDARKGAVAAITVEDEEWYRSVKLLPYSSVIAIGRDAITVASSENILTLEEASDFEAMLDENVRIIGTKAITKTGSIGGKVTELFVDEDGMVEKILTIKPDGAESEIEADMISRFGKDVTVVGEPGDGVERKREAELYAAMLASKPKAAPAPMPEPIQEAAPEIVPEPIVPETEVRPELQEITEAEIAPKPADNFTAAAVSEPEPINSPEPEAAPEPPQEEIPEPTEAIVADPEPTEIVVPEVAPALESVPIKEPEPEIFPEPTETIPEELAPEIPIVEAVELTQEQEGTLAEETASEAEPMEAPGMPEIEPEPPKEEIPEPMEIVSEPAAADTMETAAPEIEPPKEETAEPEPQPVETETPKPKRKTAAKPRKKAELASEPTGESGTEPKAKPRTRRKSAVKPKRTAEPTEDLVLELEVEPEPKKKTATRSRKKAANEPELSESAAQKTMERQRRFLLGRKATRDVSTADGVPIAKAGDVVTEEILQKASLSGKLIELSMIAQ